MGECVYVCFILCYVIYPVSMWGNDATSQCGGLTQSVIVPVTLVERDGVVADWHVASEGAEAVASRSHCRGERNLIVA